MNGRFFMTNALFCWALSSLAVPAKPGVWRFITLADGTEVRAQLVGDEFCHYYMTEDGTRYWEDGTRYEENAQGREKNVRTSVRRNLAMAHRQSRLRKLAQGGKRVFSGKKKGLIILAEFTDSKFADGHHQALYNRIANESGFSEMGFSGSVKDYFHDQSSGLFELDFDVVGICPLAHNVAYYGDNDSEGEDKGAGKMVAEACLWADQQGIDFSRYDWDGDGEVDQVFVLYAGKGEADGGSNNTVWPHMFYLNLGDYGKVLTLDGVSVNTYACSCELNGSGSLDGIGTFCHEFSHCLGFPDLYDTTHSGWFGLGKFDLMDAGNYNGDGTCPAGYSAYEKSVCGWLGLTDVTDVEEPLVVTGLQSLSEGGGAYIVRNKAYENEYYIVENRQQTHWDRYLPDAGVMITHVDYNKDIWDWNLPNSKASYQDSEGVEHINDHQRLTIFHADNRQHISRDYGHVGDLFGNQNTNLTASSKPASTLYNKNADGSYYMHVDIKDIAVASDGTASLTFSKADHSGDQNPNTPVTPSGSTLLYESFDNCLGLGGNDNLWSGNIAGTSVSSEDLDNVGWSSSGTIYQANRCIRLGKSGVAGDVTTPTFSVNGTATITFNAAAWNGQKDATKLYLEVTDVNPATRQQEALDGKAEFEKTELRKEEIRKAELSKSFVPLKKGEWTQFGATIHAAGNVKVTFASDKGRFFLDEVKVEDSILDGIDHVISTGDVKVERYYTLEGVSHSTLQPGINLVKYKDETVKKVIIHNR